MEIKLVELTQAQKELLNLLQHSEVKEYFESLKTVHYLGTYLINSELADLSASGYVHQLLDAIQKITMENNTFEQP